jgi:4-amino-4-deoxy-L-arabinose transferase-like glycosyltransferase
MSVFRIAFLAGAVVCLPLLGSTGLWDPWETHYSEVGRQMLARADLVHPYWEHHYFFSKPPLVPWLAALGLFLSGAQSWGTQGTGPLPSWVEWFIRLPIALLMLFAASLFADTVARYTSRRIGLLTAVVWWTMPLVCFISRQVMTDGPFVACLMLALGCALRAELEEKPAPWWAGAFSAVGVALLAKGLLGFLPFILIPLAWLFLDGKAALAKVRNVPWWGVPLTLLIGAPWYLAMARFAERDDEGRRFVERFFGYDHLDRLVNGVHTTTPGGTFTYFLEQGAFALAPWVLLLPLALRWSTTDERPRRLLVTVSLASLFTFTLFTASATRFHHYVLPVLPGLAVLIAVAIDRLLSEGFSTHRPALLLGAVLQALVWKDLWQRPRHLLDLFTYNHDRPYPDSVLLEPLPFKPALLGVLILISLALLHSLWRKNAQRFSGTLLVSSVAIALFLSWQHWPALGRHWTQRELLRPYFAQRLAGEPLAAFLMNWKGETFYSRNEVLQVSARDPRGELASIALQPGRAFVVVEHARLPVLRQALPPGQRLEVIAPETMNKFQLVRLDDP